MYTISTQFRINVLTARSKHFKLVAWIILKVYFKIDDFQHKAFKLHMYILCYKHIKLHSNYHET